MPSTAMWSVFRIFGRMTPCMLALVPAAAQPDFESLKNGVVKISALKNPPEVGTGILLLSLLPFCAPAYGEACCGRREPHLRDSFR